MNISLSKTYHFLAKEEMYNKITKYSNQIKLNFSKTIRLIINTMMPFLDYFIIFEQESGEFGYNQFNAEIDIRFYIDPNIYRKLKNTHGVMQTFSVAVLIRKMVELFFVLLEAKGLKWIKNAMKRGIKKIINILYKNKRLLKNPEKMIHMFGKEQMDEYISFIFSKNLTLLGVEYTKKRLSQH